MRPARPEDSAALEALFRATPMVGAITLGLERGPDFFDGAAVQCEEPEVYIVREGAACWASGTRRVFVNGRPARVRYLSDMRIHPDHQGGLVLARGFRYIREHIMAGDDRYVVRGITEQDNWADQETLLREAVYSVRILGR